MSSSRIAGHRPQAAFIWLVLAFEFFMLILEKITPPITPHSPLNKGFVSFVSAVWRGIGGGRSGRACMYLFKINKELRKSCKYLEIAKVLVCMHTSSLLMKQKSYIINYI